MEKIFFHAAIQNIDYRIFCGISRVKLFRQVNIDISVFFQYIRMKNFTITEYKGFVLFCENREKR
jgi:hypothetical protein